MCTIVALRIIERWEKRLITRKCWVHIWVMQSFSMPSESDSIQFHQIIEFDGLLSDIFDTWLKVQNMIGREKQKIPFTGLYDYMTYFTLNTFSTCMTGWGMGKWNQACTVDFTKASQFWISLLKWMPNMKKLWFREIRPAKTCKNCKNCKNYCLGKLDQD